jgi:hypothetical protein
MKRRQNLFYVLVVSIVMASLVTEAVSQRRRKTNKPPAPASAPAPPPAKDLSRTVAADLIKRDSQYRSTDNQDIPVGRFWVNSLSLDSYYLEGHNIQPLEDSGILTFLKTGKTYVLWVECVVELTAKGEEAAKSWAKGSEDDLFMSLYGPAVYGLPAKPEGALFHIPVAVKELVAVTGIVFDPSHTRAQVEFTWKWVPTANAESLPKKVPSDAIRGNAAECALYDDGWRCSWRPY